MNDAELASFIKQARQKKGLSRAEAINELGRAGVKVSYGYLNKIELGDRSLASANIELREGLRHLYRISRNEWTAQTGLYIPETSIFADQVHLESPDISGRRRIPVYDLLSAGPGSEGGTVVSHIDIGPEFVGAHAAYRISGESMSPRIDDGDIVLVRAQDYASPKNIVVCWTPEAGMVCKFLAGTENGYYVLTSINPSHAPILTREIRIYGIVVEVRQRIKVVNGNH